MSMRMIPNLELFRPADIIETAECWQLALENADGPTVLALTRQNVSQLRKEVRTRTCPPMAPTALRPPPRAQGGAGCHRFGG
jgi:transketolase